MTTLRFAAIGIDHRHIFGMAANMIEAGAEFAGWWTQGHPNTEEGFVERFPRRAPRQQCKCTAGGSLH